ncbi:hypothetical protein SDC9_164818 [bioreactor metagenome]|uniref:DISARM protein DrmE C-terminal domain-containing protein n=1 Tax=bioreactor metagenome TaxID=1076179 RepID=A0A645FSN3_9ZZZZ
MIDPESLDTGNFIVVREASKDIIRELADEILSNSGMAESCELAAKWKDALEMEGLFSDADEICRKIQSAGCRKNIFTIRQWIKNEDRIIPQDKEDLKYIAIATEDAVLAEKLDEVYEAGKNVQRAHIRAGQALSERLKQQVAEKLTASGIDPYNIWDPITLYIEGIGNVKILKVIDKGSIICVDALNVNRIIEES